jgi:uncharacterized protein YbjQ (UPF0145 family)
MYSKLLSVIKIYFIILLSYRFYSLITCVLKGESKFMIITTTPSIEGRKITEYKGVVFGEVISGVNFIKDFTAGLSNFFGGRSGTYEEELIQARENAMREMEDRARQLGADAVVGVDIDYEVLGADNGMLMVTASGTAVRVL